LSIYISPTLRSLRDGSGRNLVLVRDRWRPPQRSCAPSLIQKNNKA
jgi:hypothetical protein